MTCSTDTLGTWLRSLAPEVGERLAHLLTCPLCRAQALDHLPIRQGTIRAECARATLDYTSTWTLLDQERAQAAQRIQTS